MPTDDEAVEAASRDLPRVPPEPVEAPGQAAPTRLLEEILAEVRKASGEVRTHIKSQQFSDFSIWNLFAGLAQTLVFLALFLWYLQDSATSDNPYLTLAVVLQLMALTFFSIGKQ